MRPFRGRFFRPHGIAEEGRISRFWGDLAGFAASRDLIPALERRANLGRLSRFRYSEETGYSHLANACSVLRYISLQKVKDGNINAKIKFGAPVLMLKSKDYVL